MSRGMEVRVGITVVLGLTVLILGILGLSNYAQVRRMRIWHVRFPQTGGLGSGDEVQVNGMRKGAVRRMALVGDGVVIDLGLSREVQLTRDSRVAIRNHGMMGEKVIAVDLRTGGEPYSTRDTIPGEFEPGMSEVLGSVGMAVNDIRSLATQLDTLSRSMGRGGLGSKTARELTSEREGQIRRTLDHFAAAAENLDRLSSRLDSLRTSLQSVAAKVDRGQGSLGRMVNDDKLYTDLAASVKSLRALIDDVRANPQKYFRFSVF